MNATKIIYIIVGLVFVIGFILAIVFGQGLSTTAPQKTLDLPERNDTAPAVPILYNYDTKIVYTLDTTVNKDIYIGDCKTRGGVFNLCGNTCAPDAQVCTTLCALTCTAK